MVGYIFILLCTIAAAGSNIGPAIHEILSQVPSSRCHIQLRLKGKITSEILANTGKHPVTIWANFEVRKDKKVTSLTKSELKTEVFELTEIRNGTSVLLRTMNFTSEHFYLTIFKTTKLEMYYNGSPLVSSINRIRGWFCDHVLIYIEPPLVTYNNDWSQYDMYQHMFVLPKIAIFTNDKIFLTTKSCSFVLVTMCKSLSVNETIGMFVSDFRSHVNSNHGKLLSLSILVFVKKTICTLHDMKEVFEELKCELWENIPNIFEHFDRQITNPDEFWEYPLYSGGSSSNYRGALTNFQHFKINQYLFDLASSKLNITMVSNYSHIFAAEFNEYRDNYATSTDFGSANPNIVIVDMDGFTFTSCYTSPILSFNMYASPFSTWVWIWMIISLLASGLFIDMAWVVKTNKTEFLLSILYFYGYIIDEAAAVPAKLRNALYFKQVVWPWLLFGAILTSLHSSKLITELNSPLKGAKLSSFKDITCSSDDFNASKYGPRMQNLETSYLLYGENEYTSQKDACFAILSQPKTINFFTYELIVAKDGQLQFVFNPFLHRSGHSLYEQQVFYKLGNPKMRWVPYPGINYIDSKNKIIIHWEQIDRELSECGRSIFVGYASYIEKFREKVLNRVHPKANFYTVEDSQFKMERLRMWRFPEKSIMHKIFQKFMDSGIHKMLSEAVTFAEISKDYPINKSKIWNYFQTVNMGGSIQTIFIIAGIALFFSAIVFLVELKEYIFRLIELAWYNVFKLLLKVLRIRVILRINPASMPNKP